MITDNSTIERITDLGMKEQNCQVRICCKISQVNEVRTKQGDAMGFATAEDSTGSVELIIFPEPYIEFSKFNESRTDIHITGTVNHGEKYISLLVQHTAVAKKP